MDAPAPTASTGHTRAIRSFAHREDADRALAVLADSNITGTIREFHVPDPVTGKPVPRGCTLCIAPGDAAAAARLLLKMAPSEAPASVSAKPEGPSRLRRLGVKSGPQKTSLFVVGFAVLSVAGMILFAANTLFGPKKPKAPPAGTANIILEEDLNGDAYPDVIREFTYNWVPIYHSEDRNFDSLIDHRWIYQKGKPAYTDVDLNADGKFDERTTYDPKGQPFYTDTRPGADGPVLVRKIMRDGILWKLLEDRDADNHFDHLTEFNDIATPIREEELPKDSVENNPPPWPPPPAPESPYDDPEEKMEVRGKS